MSILTQIIFVIWFYLPAQIANTAPVFASKWGIMKFLDKPLDGGRSYRGVRILGDHKTYRGFVSGITASIIVVYFQVSLSEYLNMNQIDYSSTSIIKLGFLMGFGALTGDAIKSFFKRCAGVKPGESWLPFDQIDFVIGASLFTYFYIPLALTQYLLALITLFILHLSSTYVGYLLKIRKDPI